jgi:hypothetical protein
LPARRLSAGQLRMTLLPSPINDRSPTCSPFMMLEALPM